MFGKYIQELTMPILECCPCSLWKIVAAQRVFLKYTHTRTYTHTGTHLNTSLIMLIWKWSRCSRSPWLTLSLAHFLSFWFFSLFCSFVSRKKQKSKWNRNWNRKRTENLFHNLIYIGVYARMYVCLSVYMLAFDVWTVFHILRPSLSLSFWLLLLIYVFVLVSLPLWVFPFTRSPWKILSHVIKYVCMLVCWSVLCRLHVNQSNFS